MANGTKSCLESVGESAEEENEKNESGKSTGVASEFLGVPLVDFDLTGDKTFVVVVNRFGKQVVYRFSKKSSLYLFSPKSSIRQWVIYITTNQYFEMFILLLIICNCVILAFKNPPEEIEYVFAALYTLEMILNIIAKGFAFHKFAFLRDYWNWMDFVVVILGYVTLAPSVANLSGIRTFRVLRALRTISVVEGLKTMVNAFLRSLRILADVVILASSFVSIFALIGMQLFAGILKNKCVLSPGANMTIDFDTFLANKSNWLHVNDDPVVCGNGSTARSCPVNYTCFSNVGDNPNHGYTNFDSFPWALVCTIQLVTADFWENVYEYVIAAGGFWYVFYFVLVIFFGSFYLINLILAAVSLSYEQELVNIQSQAAGYDHARKSSSSYSLRVNTEPELLFAVKPRQPIPGWPTMIRLLDTKRPYGGETSGGIPPGTYHPKPPDPRNTTPPCSVDIIVERLEPSPLNGPSQTESDLVMASENIGNILVKNPADMDIEDKTLVVQTSSLCVVIPSDKDVKGHRTIMNTLRRHCALVVVNPAFDWFITGAIFLNTTFMAIEHHGMDKQLEIAVDVINYICTLVFVLEMFVKMVALSPRGYVQSRWNLLDGFIVIMSIVDLLIVLCLPGSHHGAGFSILRSLRLVRVFKLAKSWVTMRNLLTIIGDSIGALGNLTLLLALVVYTFAVVGMQLFSESFKAENFHDNEVPRWNFSDFFHSFMMIFRVLCGEWIEPLILTMHATSPVAILFYFAILALGHFLIFNLFLALLLNSFEVESLNVTTEHSRNVRDRFRHVVGKLLNILRAFRRTTVNSETSTAGHETVSQHETTLAMEGLQDATGIENNHKLQSNVDKQNSPDSNRGLPSISERGENENEIKDEPDVDQPNENCKANEHVDQNVGSHGDISTEAQSPGYITSLCCPKPLLSFTNICRSRFLKVVEHKFFDGFILIVILLSSISMTFEDIYLDSKPTLKSILDIFNFVVTGIFTLEFILKILAFGVVRYFRSAWNCLDFAVVVVSIVSLVNSIASTNDNLTAFRSMRTFRALRPLRAIPRWQGMKVVVNSLLFAIPEIGNVSLVCLVFWLIFSIMGVQFFGGKFYKCVDEDGEVLPYSITPNKTTCLSMDYEWKNSDINFDDSLNGFLALFQVATLEGWIELMADASDITKVDEQPRKDNSYIFHLYFVVFVLIGSFFVLNLFVGVIIENFNRLKEQYEGHGAMSLFLTDTQRAWYDTLRKAASKKPKKVVQKPNGKWRGALFDVVTSPRFELVIMLLIMANMVVLMVQHHGQSTTVTTVLSILYCNLVFTAMFLIEFVLRVYALRWDYFKEPWNDFDCIVVLLSIAGVIFEFQNHTFVVTPNIFRVIRVLRVGRLLRFYKNARGIRRLLFTLLISLPALVNIGALLFLVLFIYSIIGMSSFAYVKHSGAINDMVNFETFGNSILLLFRISTSAGWNDILGDLMTEPPDCDPTHDGRPNGNCGNAHFAIFYFVSFVLFTSLIIVNLFIAVILENLHEAFREETAGINEDDLDMFYSKWEHFDPRATQYIPHDQLSDFVDSLEGPLRIPKPNKFACVHLHIPIHDGDTLHCVDVLQALVHQVIGDIEKENPEAFFVLQKALEESFLSAFPNRAKQRRHTTTFLRNREVQAALRIQKAWRARARRRDQSLRAVDAFQTVSSENQDQVDDQTADT